MAEQKILLTPGSAVFDGAQCWHLDQILKNGEGGEGAVFSLKEEPEMVAKIFREKASNDYRFKKLSKMISRQYEILGNPRNKSIAWPRHLLRNMDGQPVGYCMQKVDGISVQSGFMSRTARDSLFKKWGKDWDMKQLLWACVSMMQAFKRLHSQEVLMADVNGGNILFDRDGHAHLVDTDSYQMKEYPCLVGTEEYLSVEYRKRSKGDYHVPRELMDEYYAITVLLFEILMAGESPYNNMMGESGLFPYHLTFGEKEPEEWYIRTRQYQIGGKRLREEYQPSCKWVWNELPYKMKVRFFKTFVPEAREKGEGYTSPDEWRSLLRDYIRNIESGNKRNEIWPETSKAVKNENGEVVSAQKAVCSCCGTEFDVTSEKNQRFYQGKEKLLCPLCEKMQTEPIMFYCTSCGEYVEMRKMDYDFLVLGENLQSSYEGDYYLCPACLKEVRKERAQKERRQKTLMKMKSNGKMTFLMSLRYADLKKAGYFQPVESQEPVEKYEKILEKYRPVRKIVPVESEARLNCVMDRLCEIVINFEILRKQVGDFLEQAVDLKEKYWCCSLPMGFPAKFIEFLYWEEEEKGKIQKWLQICLTDKVSKPEE